MVLAAMLAWVPKVAGFAALFGTFALLPEDLRAMVRGFVINKLRGDPALLAGGPDELQCRTGVPTLGVLPWMRMRPPSLAMRCAVRANRRPETLRPRGAPRSWRSSARATRTC